MLLSAGRVAMFCASAVKKCPLAESKGVEVRVVDGRVTHRTFMSEREQLVLHEMGSRRMKKSSP